MPMLEKLKNLEINLFQNIALTGIALSIMAQVGLLLMGKQVNSFWYVYVVWGVVLVLSSVIKAPSHDHHHDH
jgi:hypothetical protein